MSKRYIPVTVNNEFVSGSGVVIGAAGSHNDVYLRMTFENMWDDLIKYVTFRDSLGENPTMVMIMSSMLVEGTEDTYDVPVPAAGKTREGRMMVTVSGYTVVEDTIEDTATLTTTAYFRVLPSDAALLEDGSIDATLAQQLQCEIEVLAGDDYPTIRGIVDDAIHTTEAWATGTRGGVPVSEEDETYHNNSKYYAQQAEDAAESAAAEVLAEAPAMVENWLGNHVDPESGYVLDSSLSLPTAAAPANKVGELKSAISDNQNEFNSFLIISSNLFLRTAAVIEGYYKTNGTWADTNLLVGEYIRIKPNTKYTISGAYTFSAALDINKTWIASYMNTADPYTLTSPANAAFLYVATAPDIVKSIIVNEGETAITYTEGYKIPKMANSGLSYGEVSANATDFASTGSNLIDASTYEDGYYYSSTSGIKIAKASYSYIFLLTKAGIQYTLTGSEGHIAFYTNGMRFLSGGVVGDSNSYTFTVPDNTKYLAISVLSSNKGNVRLNIGSTDRGYETYKILIPKLAIPELFDYTKYNYPYIRGQKVMCNKASDTVTAYYAGVDCGEKINTIIANWIWEVGNSSGTVALIMNKNGADRVANITDLSLHLVLDNEHVKVDVLGDAFGTRYYQTIINEQFATPMTLDGETEHNIIFTVNTSTNKVNVYIDNNTYVYEGTFTPDSNIAGLNDVIGQYAIFEHYTATDRDTVAMPMFTYFYCRDINNYVRVKDYFDRQDGQLSTTPQGQTYHLMSTAHYNG